MKAGRVRLGTYVRCFALLSSMLLGCASSAEKTVEKTAEPGRDWRLFNGSYSAERYSPLTEITTVNVGHLARACTFDTGENPKSFESGPVVVNGTLYVTTDINTYAVDTRTCALLWKHAHPYSPPSALGANRGVAYLDGRLFRGSGDGHVFAIEARTGKSLWDVAIADPSKGESVPLAPLVWNGLVFAGNAGGDNFGVTGRVYALRAADGQVVWQFDVVPKSGPAAATWPPASPDTLPTGGGTWTSYSLDPSAGIVYIPTGNAAPDFAPALRAGKNLYTNSIVALDARTGELLSYVQPIQDDFHDYDVAATPVLITTRGGQHLALAAGKDGFLYGVDRSAVRRGGSQEGSLGVRYKTETTTHLNTTTPLSTTEPVRFCPGTQGGTEWNGPAYHPQENLVFVAAVDWCTSVQLGTGDMLKSAPGQPWTGSADPSQPFGHMDPKEKWGGWLTAVDADTGAVRWRYHSSAPMLAAVTATAGGLVLTGEVTGTFLAFRASDGVVLWKDHLGDPMAAGIVTFEVDGHQRVAVGTGRVSPLWPVESQSAKVVVYALPTSSGAR